MEHTNHESSWSSNYFLPGEMGVRKFKLITKQVNVSAESYKKEPCKGDRKFIAELCQRGFLSCV